MAEHVAAAIGIVVRCRTRSTRIAAVTLVTAVVACGDDPLEPAVGDTTVEVIVHGLAPLDATVDGSYEVWLVDDAGQIVSAGRFAGSNGAAQTFRAAIADPTHIMFTVEPPNDEDAQPSLMKLMGGKFESDSTTTLDVTGYLTPVGIPLEPEPGVHVLGTAPGRDTDEAPADAGLWLVDARVDSADASYFQTFAPLTRGWSYEGWIVRDYENAGEVWLSYGQFVPNNLRKARYRDDTGIGPFSGYIDYERALSTQVHYPGDDWVANPHGHAVPGGLSLPIDLNGDAAADVASRWTHVITIEPRYEPDGIRTESPWEAQPFFLRPYRNVIGDASPAEPRAIGFTPETLPGGSARIVLPAGS